MNPDAHPARWSDLRNGCIGADLKTRQIVLSDNRQLPSFGCSEVNGYAPFDDSLPGEDPLTVFEIIRNELKVMT